MKKYNVYVNGEPFEVIVEEADSPALSTPVIPKSAIPKAQQTPAAKPTISVSPSEEKKKDTGPKTSVGFQVVAPMPGSVINVKVKVGDNVNEGDTLLILEAMKMENEVTAPTSGLIKSIHVASGSTVNTGDVMIVIE
jgi:biotin carboxyl carrier protein